MDDFVEGGERTLLNRKVTDLGGVSEFEVHTCVDVKDRLTREVVDSPNVLKRRGHRVHLLYSGVRAGILPGLRVFLLHRRVSEPEWQLWGIEGKIYRH